VVWLHFHEIINFPPMIFETLKVGEAGCQSGQASKDIIGMQLIISLCSFLTEFHSHVLVYSVTMMMTHPNSSLSHCPFPRRLTLSCTSTHTMVADIRHKHSPNMTHHLVYDFPPRDQIQGRIPAHSARCCREPCH
jgi:hypothetical protein